MQELAEVFTEHILANCAGYFPELQSKEVTVSLTTTDVRRKSRLYHYLIGVGEKTYPIVVKARSESQQSLQNVSERPFRFKLDLGEDLISLEARALSTIYECFHQQNNPNLGAIRMLDSLPEHQAFIMLEVFDKSLRSLVLQQNRIQRFLNKVDLVPAIHNAGAWLRQFHSIPPDDITIECYKTKTEYFQVVIEFVEYLKYHLNDHNYFDTLIHILTTQMNARLPEELPLGRLHADFSTRNILVGKDSGVIGIDTLARWHAPIYEDIATFLNWFWVNQFQVHSRGWMFDPNLLQQYQRAFLQGYFGDDPIPESAIALFRITVMLDQWADRIDLIKTASHPKATNNIRFLRARLWTKRFKEVIADLVKHV